MIKCILPHLELCSTLCIVVFAWVQCRLNKQLFQIEKTKVINSLKMELNDASDLLFKSYADSNIKLDIIESGTEKRFNNIKFNEFYSNGIIFVSTEHNKGIFELYYILYKNIYFSTICRGSVTWLKFEINELRNGYGVEKIMKGSVRETQPNSSGEQSDGVQEIFGYGCSFKIEGTKNITPLYFKLKKIKCVFLFFSWKFSKIDNNLTPYT